MQCVVATHWTQGGRRLLGSFTLPGLLVVAMIAIAGTTDVTAHALQSDAQRSEVHHRVKRFNPFVLPGTVWCGLGDRSGDNYTKLGSARDADKCCRTHDHCSPKVKALKYKYHLFNWRLYTLNHCTCNIEFKECLYAANTTTADLVGKWFFNRLGLKCFHLVMEKVCLQRAWWGACRKYGKEAVAHVSSSGTYVWWLKTRPMPDTVPAMVDGYSDVGYNGGDTDIIGDKDVENDGVDDKDVDDKDVDDKDIDDKDVDKKNIDDKDIGDDGVDDKDVDDDGIDDKDVDDDSVDDKDIDNSVINE